MRKRSVKTKLLIQLRKIGMLCRKQKPHKYELKLSHTIMPEGDNSPLQSSRFVFLQNKVSSIKGCNFNPETEDCICGVDVDGFLGKSDEFGNLVMGCPKKK